MHTRPPLLLCRSVGQALSRRSKRSCSHLSISASTHPTRLGPRVARLGNAPAFSSLATCCGEYKTNSLSWRFDSILIPMPPLLKSIAAVLVPNSASALPNPVALDFAWLKASGQCGRCRRLDRTSVVEIANMNRDGLVALWSEIMGSPAPRGMSQVLLHAFLAFEVQQRSDGGLTKADLDRLDRIGIGMVRAKAPNMNAGARFLREWNGVTHVVERVAAGYLWNGKSFASLSAIAKEITGAHWSGPRFFRVRKATLSKPAVARRKSGAQA